MDQQEFFPRAIGIGRSRPLGAVIILNVALEVRFCRLGLKRVRYRGVSRHCFACAQACVCIDVGIFPCLNHWTYLWKMQ